MPPITFLVEFEGTHADEASILSQNLRRSLLAVYPDISVKRLRDNPSAMDFGGLLEVTLSAPAIIMVLKLIRDWIKTYPKASITIKKPNNEVVVRNITHKQAFDLAALSLSLGGSENDSKP